MRRRAWLAAAGSVAAFAVAFFLRMNQAYGPFNLSARPGDWQVLWELLRHQQIAGRIVLEGAGARAAGRARSLAAARVRHRSTNGGERPASSGHQPPEVGELLNPVGPDVDVGRARGAEPERDAVADLGLGPR